MDRDRILRLLRRGAQQLLGDWLLVGGGAAAVWFSPERTTEDLDLVGLPGTQRPRLQLLELAEREGLAVETLNSAADFFVSRVDGWSEGTTLVVDGEGARFHLPSPTVFLLTKLHRLSEVDLDDCLALLDHARTTGLPLDAERVVRALDGLGEPASAGQAGRRRALRAALQGTGVGC